MSTVAEIENAIQQLSLEQRAEIRRWLDTSAPRAALASWPVPPPKVGRAELERIEAEIEAEFPTLRG